jgi:uncharacterized protein
MFVYQSFIKPVQKQAVALILLALMSGLMFDGCYETQSNSTANPLPDDMRSTLLKSIRTEVIIPLLNQLEPNLTSLRVAIEAQNLDSAREAWRSSMLAWHQLELLQFGPAGISGLRVGGQDIRDQIYAFPLTNPCRVDQVLVGQSFTESNWVKEASINVIGLDAIEHLLFQEGGESVCPEQSQLIRDGEWAAFQEDEANATIQKWSYLKVLIAGVQAKHQLLLTAWTGSFGVAFEEAQEPFTSQREAVDQIFAGIFYLDEVIKDLKVGAPAGIYMTCLESRCPELLEHRRSMLSGQAIESNLTALRAIFEGKVAESTEASFGLTKLLIAEGASELSRELEALIVSNLERIREMPSLEQSLDESPEEVEALHASIKELCDLMKSQMVTVLNLSVPQEGAGDND